MKHNKRKGIDKKTPEMMEHQPSSSCEMDAWNEEKHGAATLAVAKEFNARLCSMINAFSNGGSGGGARGVSGGIDGIHGDGGNAARASSLTGNYQPLVWSHFIGVETAARRLSKIAFPFTDVCHRLTLRVEKGKPGFVRKSFAERHLLWKKPVMVQLQLIQEESRKAANDKIDTAANVNGKEEKEGKEQQYEEADAHPNINDIRRWREVVVAMLKPQTDFGWHHYESKDGDAVRKSMSSKEREGLELTAIHKPSNSFSMSTPLCRISPTHSSTHASGEFDDLDGKENETVLQLCNTGGGEDGVRRPKQGEGRDYHNTYTMHGGLVLSSDMYEETKIESPTDFSTVNVRIPGDTFGTYQDVEAGEYVDVWIPDTREHAPEGEVVPGVMPRPGAIPGGAQVTAPTEKAKAMEKQEEKKQEEEKKGGEKKEEDGVAMSVKWHDKANTIEAIHAPWNTPTSTTIATTSATGGAVIGVEPGEASDIEASEETSVVGGSDVSEDTV